MPSREVASEGIPSKVSGKDGGRRYRGAIVCLVPGLMTRKLGAEPLDFLGDSYARLPSDIQNRRRSAGAPAVLPAVVFQMAHSTSRSHGFSANILALMKKLSVSLHNLGLSKVQSLAAAARGTSKSPAARSATTLPDP